MKKLLFKIIGIKDKVDKGWMTFLAFLAVFGLGNVNPGINGLVSPKEEDIPVPAEVVVKTRDINSAYKFYELSVVWERVDTIGGGAFPEFYVKYPVSVVHRLRLPDNFDSVWFNAHYGPPQGLEGFKANLFFNKRRVKPFPGEELTTNNAFPEK